MSNLLDAFGWFVVVTVEMVALFLVLSFLIGLLQAWIPDEKLRSMFEKRGPVGAYLGGAALGAITPFCSFSTIPVLVGLLKAGFVRNDPRETRAFQPVSTHRYARSSAFQQKTAGKPPKAAG